MTATSRFLVKKVAVLGAGVMGAQIATHLANANIETLLFDLAAKEGDPNGIVNASLTKLKKLKPNPAAALNKIDAIQAANYTTDLEKLRDCDLIIEAIAEKLEWKIDLYKKIAPFINDHAIVASNTSGLSINSLSSVIPTPLQPRFCGVHFFNPPRYMRLIELTPSEKTNRELLPELETFLVSTLGKGVVYAKDTPNFIANRVGVFAMLSVMQLAEKFGLSLEVVDALTGPAIGRAKSATLRTADVVGLDTMAHVINTMTENLPNDPWAACYKTPAWMQKLIAAGQLGQKTGAGVFKKVGKDIHVLDLKTGEYRAANQQPHADVLAILKIKNPAEKFKALRESKLPEAQFLWTHFRDLFHYCAYHLEDIAESVRDIDLALRWGFGWKMGPFEIWQSAGWQPIAQAIAHDIEAKTTAVTCALPAWVSAKDRAAVYAPNGAYAPKVNAFTPRSNLPVYQRQIFKDPVLCETFDEGTTITESDAFRLWHQNDGVAILSFKTKANCISTQVLEGVVESVNVAEKFFKGLVLWQRHGDHFSVGADLSNAVAAITSGQQDKFYELVAKFQRASLALRYSQVPTIAAVKGYTFGGGCELTMHCTRAIATLESYIGLVEAGVGLLPAGGGTKEFARRLAVHSKGDEVIAYRLMQNVFKTIAMAEASDSAQNAIEKGYLCSSDIVVFNPDEALFVAKQQALSLHASCYHPPLPARIPVLGKNALATLETGLVNYRDGGFISEHDFLVGYKIAEVLCGGKLDAGTMVDEEWFLRLEREGILALALTKKTQERITYTLANGKPLRN